MSSTDSGREAPQRRVTVIYNPAAGWRRRRKLVRVLGRLRDRGAAVVLLETSRRGDAEEFARMARRKDTDVLAVAGGDGTINEAINGLDAGAPPLAVIPLGTANVFAHELGLPAGADQIARIILEGRERMIHVARLDGRRFIQMAGAGFDAYVVEQVSPSLKRSLGKLAYVLKMAFGLFVYHYGRYHVTVDGKSYEAASVVIANGHYYGGKFVCAPDARPDVPRLEVCLFKSVGAINVIRYAYGLAAGRLGHFPDVETVSGTRIRIDGTAGEPVQADGDVVARLPVTASMGDSRIPVIVGATS